VVAVSTILLGLEASVNDAPHNEDATGAAALDTDGYALVMTLNIALLQFEQVTLEGTLVNVDMSPLTTMWTMFIKLSV